MKKSIMLIAALCMTSVMTFAQKVIRVSTAFFSPASFSLCDCCFFAHTVVFSSHLCKKKNGGSSDIHIKKRKLS